MVSQVHDELYAEYGRGPTEAEGVSRLKSRLEQDRTAVGAASEATRPDRPASAELGQPAAGKLDLEVPNRRV